MVKIKLALAAALILSVAGCMSTDGQRALVGAAAGAAVADITDNNVATGALIGAAGGALLDDATGL